MKKIDININQARISAFTADFDEEGHIDVSATIELLAGGKKISQFTLGTKSWDDRVMEVPVSIINSVLGIGKDLEAILVRETTKSLKILKEKN